MGFFKLLTWWVCDISQWFKSWSIDDNFLISSSRFDSASNKRNMSQSVLVSIPGNFHLLQFWMFLFRPGKMLIFTGEFHWGNFSQENDVYICQIQSRRTTMATFVCCFGTRKHKSPRLPCTMQLVFFEKTWAGYGWITLSNCREPIKMCPINIRTLLPLPRMFFMSE